MEHNTTCVTLQEMVNEIKLIAKEIEISQIDHRICTGYQCIVYKHPDQNKETDCLIGNPGKISNLKPPQLWSYEDFQTNSSLLYFSATKT